VPKTVLVETLLECEELQLLYGSLPQGAESTRVKRQIAVCEGILDYLRERYAGLNCGRSGDEAAAQGTLIAVPASGLDLQKNRAELAGMDDLSLLRYGTVLKYICTAEAELADLPAGTSKTMLREAQAEWRRRFGQTVIGDSI
jgi:hypothetical protein